MLPFEPEDMALMKKRFIKALEHPIDAVLVYAGQQKAASSRREHVFDFPDGMRMVISVDIIEKGKYLHISASGTEEYASTIKDEGFEGLVEDVIIRAGALCNGTPGDQMHAVMSDKGVLHLIFEVDYERLIERSKGTGSGN